MQRAIVLRVKNRKINFTPILYAILLAPFFESFVISMFISDGINTSFWNLIANIYTVARFIVSTYAIVRMLYRLPKHSIKINGVLFWCLMYLVMQVVSCVLNGSFTANQLLGLYSYIGFVVLCREIQNQSQKLFFKAVIALFAILSGIGVVTTVIFPNGFFNAPIKAYAYYALGSKNSSFFYFYSLMFAWFGYSMAYKGKLPRWGGICIFVLILTAAICDSGNSMICLGIILVFYLLEKYWKGLFKYVNPKLLFFGVCLIAVIIYAGINLPLIELITGSIGRNVTFTGRDMLWTSAVYQFASSPVFGVGQNATFMLSNGTEATHAHSLFLDIMAKYGLVTAIPLFALFICMIKKMLRLKNRLLINQIGVFLFAAILHMVFDVPSGYFLLLIVALTENISLAKRNLCSSNSMKQQAITQYRRSR